MIRMLRRRFLLIAMASLTATLALLCLVIHLGNAGLTARRADMVIQLLHQNDGGFPKPQAGAAPAWDGSFQITSETPFETRYCIVRLTDLGTVAEVDMEHIAALDRRSVLERVEEIMGAGRETGYSSHYRFAAFEETDGGSTVIVLDCFQQLQGVNNALRVTILASLACIAIVFALLLPLSRRVVRPFAENLERQRQFVTDASHELRTPLAVLSANTDLLLRELGENRWLDSSCRQIRRLDRLVGDLVELARTEETGHRLALAPVDLSEAVVGAAEDFRPLALAAGKELETALEEGIVLPGDARLLNRLLALLLDNGVKYCDPGGVIRLALTRRGRWAVLTVENPCAGLDPSSVSRLFDRFYRGNAARSGGPGGYGIGLSTARAITAGHRGRISARYTGGGLCITVLLPLR